MRRAELTANGVDIALHNKADAVRLVGVEIEPEQLAMLQELREGVVVLDIDGAPRVCAHRKCRPALADAGERRQGDAGARRGRAHPGGGAVAAICDAARGRDGG